MYDIKPYTFARAKQLGVKVKPSLNPKKKIDVYKDGQLKASIGDVKYSDFPTYIESHGLEFAKERKRLYHIRHTQQTLGELLSRFLLW
jgi:hypothetical protein